jgi:ABC-type transport system involved in multi-copper enzyme maturation permease subunit
MTATITPYRSPEQTGRDGFAQLLHAEWTKFRTLRGWVIAVVIAAVLIAVVGALLPRGGSNPCGGAACLTGIPTGPGGEAVNDQYYLAGQPLAGGGSITAAVTSLTGMISNQGGGYVGRNGPQQTVKPGLVPWAKAGIIITASTRPGAAYAAMMVTGRHGVRMQYDYTSDIGGLPGSVSAASPRWLRLTRSGDVITGYDSANGRNWTEVGTATLAGLTGTVRAGLFATSPVDFTPNFPTYSESGGGINATSATGTFDDVALRGGAPGGQWAGQLVGSINTDYAGLPRIGFHQAAGQFTLTGTGDIGPIVAGGVNSTYDTGTLSDHLFGVFFALLIMIVIAAMFITVEYRRGLIATSLATSPRRGRLLAAKAVVIGLVTFVLGSAGVAVAVIIGAHAARNSGIFVLATGWASYARIIVGTGAMLALASVLALAIGTVLRRSVAAVAAVIVAIVLPYLLGVTGVLPATVAEWILRVTPAAGYAIVQTVPQYTQVVGHYGPPDYYPLGPWSGLAVLCAYVAVACGFAVYLLRRRDAGGVA